MVGTAALFILFVMADARRSAWAPRKRRGAASGAGSAESTEGIEMVDFEAMSKALVAERKELFEPINSSGVYNMREPEEKKRLARDLWAGKFSESMTILREQNAELVELLRAKLANSSEQTEFSQAAKERHIDGVLLDLTRGQNMFKIPLLTAAMALVCEVNGTSREYHDCISAFHMGAACSERWVDDFLPIANACRPSPAEATLPGVICCCFDNLSMKIDYGSYSTEGETGRLLDMTNWFSTRLPAHLAPNFNAKAICARCCTPSLPHAPA